MATLICCVPTCSATADVPPGCEEALCGDHLALASSASRRRLTHRSARLDRLEALRADDRAFEAIFASDRHLKLCAVIDHASEMATAAWVRVKLEVLVETARRDGKPPLVLWQANR